MGKQHRILHLIETTGPGGAETVMLSIVKRLDPDKFASTVVVTGPGWLHDRLIENSIDTHIITSAGANDFKFIKQIVSLVYREEIDLIHSHLAGINFYATVIGMITRRPVIATYHGMVGQWYQPTIKNKIKNAILKRCTASIVAVSDFLKDQLVQTLRFDPDQVVRIYNGVDFEVITGAKPNDSVRTSLGVSQEAHLVGMVGNVRRPKGYEFFVRAARKVVDQFGDCRFVIVGQGSGELLEQLREEIKKLHLDDHVLLTGFREDVAEILASLDVFVLSSTTEGLSIATIEAMAAERPVVVTDSGGPSEIVNDDRIGFLVPPADPDALAQKIILCLSDPRMAERMGKEARQAVMKKFSIEQNVQAYELLYAAHLNKTNG